MAEDVEWYCRELELFRWMRYSYLDMRDGMMDSVELEVF